jgi:uncharacterized protein YijF (DUF1287 family)
MQSRLHAVYLESHDEITDVIDQITTCPDPVIALVAADRIGLLQSLVNLKILKRASESQHKRVVLVSSDAIANALAQQLDIATYPKLGVAEAAVLRGEDYTPPAEPAPPAPAAAPQPQSPPRPIPKSKLNAEATGMAGTVETAKNAAGAILNKFRKPADVLPLQNIGAGTKPLVALLLIFLLLPIGVGAYAAVAIFPYAKITVAPVTENFSQTFDVIATARATAPDIFAKEIPAFYYESIETASGSAAATEQKDVGTKARGTVTLYNRGYSRAIALAKGTGITSYDGQTFFLTADVLIPAAQLDEGQVSASRKAGVVVEAAEVGEEFNIDKTIFTIPGYDGKNVWGESNESFTGGEKHQTIVVGQSDIDALRTRLIGELMPKTENAVRGQLPGDQIFLQDALISQADEVTTNVPLGTETAEFTMRVRVVSRGLAVREADLQKIVDQAMRETIPPKKEALSPDSWNMDYEVQDIDFDRRTIAFGATGTGPIVPEINFNEMKKQLQGKDLADANLVMDLYDGEIQEYLVEIGPFWVDKVPARADKITVERVTLDQLHAVQNPE